MMNNALQKALAFLPHGPEFRFVDRLLSLDPGKAGTGEYHVRGDESCLSGHFPDEPIFPGVLLAEAAAQLAGTVAQSDPGISPLPNLKLAAMRKIKILGSAKPGQTILIEALIIGRFSNLIQAEVAVRIGKTLLLAGELTLSGGP